MSKRTGDLFTAQPELVEAPIHFDGETYAAGQDYRRLTSALKRVHWLLSHPPGRWWTLAELCERTGSSEAGVSARLRDLRNDKFGGFDVEAGRVGGGNGLWQYRMTRRQVRVLQTSIGT